MRTDAAVFAHHNLSKSRAPQFVVRVEFDLATSDNFFITSGANASVPVGTAGGDIASGAFQFVSSTSQTITPDKGASTIGSISFKAVDVSDALTDKIRTKLGSSFGLRGKTATFYIGHADLAFTEYVVFQTQIIQNISVTNDVYEFFCEDIKREARKEIFKEVRTTLGADLTAAATSMTVVDNTAFTMVAHGTSYSDAASSTVGYLQIKQGDKREVIRYTGTSSTTGFTGLTRGVLGTTAEAFTYESGGDEDGIKVDQYVYLEMPALKLAYALLTGDLIGQAATLPAEWHLGISTTFVSQAAFTDQNDIYDSSDDTLGFQVRFEGVPRQDGKTFIEKEIMLLIGAFMPVQADGSIGVKRMSDVQPDSGYDMVLDSSNIVQYGALQHDMTRVINEIEINWNWQAGKKAFSRRRLLLDTASQTKHGAAPTRVLNFKGLHGSIHAQTILNTLFDTLRDRYSGPPLELSVKCLPSANVLEVGDTVRVVLPINDYDDSATLDRTFEVQKVTMNHITGEVWLSLFGGSERAGVIVPDATSNIADAWYTPGGSATEITAANFPGNVTSGGATTTVTGNITLAGNADMNNTAAMYYSLANLTINSGVTVTVNKNVQVRVKGFLTINGSINGVGLAQDGTNAGYVGTMLEAQWGLQYVRSDVDYLAAAARHMGLPLQTIPLHSRAPHLDVEQDASGIISAFPTDCRGTDGATGGPVKRVHTPHLYDSAVTDPPSAVPPPATTAVSGGAGGTGGAGLTIVSRGGSFGASGEIDLSGGNAAAGGVTPALGSAGRVLHAGAGSPGGPGACHWVIDGRAATQPALSSKFVGKYGSVDLGGSNPDVQTRSDGLFGGEGTIGGQLTFPVSAAIGLHPSIAGGKPTDSAQVDISSSCQRLQVESGFVTPADDVDGPDTTYSIDFDTEVTGPEKPANNATVRGDTIGMEINATGIGVSNNMEAVLFGIDENGDPDATVAPSFIADGELFTMGGTTGTYRSLYGYDSIAADRRAVIIYDTAEGTPFYVNTADRNLCIAWQEDDGDWVYDNNSGTTAFTKADSYKIIGSLFYDTSGTPSFGSGTIFQNALSMEYQTHLENINRPINTTSGYLYAEWITDDDTTYTPSATTLDMVASFEQGGTTVATRTVRFTRASSGGPVEDITAASVSSTGETTTGPVTVSGSGTPNIVVDVTHTSSGSVVRMQCVVKHTLVSAGGGGK